MTTQRKFYGTWCLVWTLFTVGFSFCAVIAHHNVAVWLLFLLFAMICAGFGGYCLARWERYRV